MRRSTLFIPLLMGALGLAAIGCGSTKTPPAPQAPAVSPAEGQQPAAAPAGEPAPAAAPAGKEPLKAAPMKSASEPSKPAAATPVQPAAKEPVAAPAAAKPAAAPAAAAAASAPSKEAEPPAASPHPKVGPEKCMMCHRVQYASWKESKHNAKGLDCEGCHGNGGDYKTMPVMKDRAAAVKAGLILPGLVFCKKCHVKADASMLALVHAHKAK